MESQIFSQTQGDSIVVLSINKVQTYAWGSKDKNCFVGRMATKQSETYAEFWMGTHQNGESKLNEQISLKQYLSSKGVPEVEFLFKILSIQKCLSIQAHPNEQEAKILNEKFPQTYVDAKDKPEMFLTLSEEFQLFLGFIEEKQFSELLKIQPFQSLSSHINQNSHQQKLLKLLEILVHLDQSQLQEKITILKANLTKYEESRQKIILRIFQEFGVDSGILVSCILKYKILPKGSCFGIEAGVPHAYIKGECFELMKNSDNVIRLGLTPKKKDIPNLMKIIRNNISRSYCRVERREENLIEKYEWNSYWILKIKLTIEPNDIQIDTNSIGLIFQGQAFISQPKSYKQPAQLAQKTVFFLHKGVFSFKGQGSVIIASKS